VPEDCKCDLGYTGPNGGPCVACVEGKYKPTNGTNECTQCAPGKYLPSTASTTDACASCGADHYSSANNSMCIACPSNAVSAESSSVPEDCKCDLGYTGPNGGPCVACVEGKYKPTNGTNECTQCAPGTYSTVKALRGLCASCPAYSYSGGGSSVITNCTCNMGYTGDDGAACVACAGGTFKDTAGSSACSPCPNNTLSPSGSIGISDCACMAGYTGSGGAEPCQACAHLYHKPSPGSAPCTSCASGKVAVRAGSERMLATTASTECRTVSVGSVFPQGSTASPFTRPTDVAVSAAGTVATVVQGTSQVVHKLSLNPASRAVTHSAQVADQLGVELIRSD